MTSDYAEPAPYEVSDLPVEYSEITLTITMNGNNYSIRSNINNSLSKVKSLYLNRLFDRCLTEEELSNYCLAYEGSRLDESKQIKELNLKSQMLECIPIRWVKIFYEDGNDRPLVLKFFTAVSVERLLSVFSMKYKTDAAFLTLKNSPIIWKTPISTSLELTGK